MLHEGERTQHGRRHRNNEIESPTAGIAGPRKSKKTLTMP
jgi:hypothetical protein